MSDIVDTRIPPLQEKELQEDTSTDVNPPQPIPTLSSLFKEMKIEDKITTDIGPHCTIDVLPDFRFILYQLVTQCLQVYEQIKTRDIPAITPVTLLAASLLQIYSYGACADTWLVREAISLHGQTFFETEANKQLLNLISWMNTPPFVLEIIRGLVPTFDARRKNMCFIYSFAAYSFFHDFGRIFPVHMFIALHNIIVEKGINATLNDVWLEWLQYPVYHSLNEEPIRVANLIGAAYNNNRVDNYLTRKLLELLSVTTLDQRQRKPVFKPYKFRPIEIVYEYNHMDAYSYALGAHPETTQMYMSFINEFTRLFEQIFTASKPLGSAFEIDSGTNLMNHFYCEPQLPTYHSIKVSIEPKTIKTTTLSAFAEALKFKCTSKCTIEPNVKVTPPASETRSTYTEDLYLITKSETAKSDPDIKKHSFQYRSNEPLILFSPWNNGDSAMYYPLTNGVHIETFEIDSFHVPYPRIDTSINKENSHFLESAIPLEATIDSRHLDGNTNLFVRYRTLGDDDNIRVSHSYIDMSRHNIPYYPTTVATSITGQLLPGFQIQRGITHPNLATTKVAYSEDHDWSTTACEEYFPEAFYVWSSYRWINPMNAYNNTLNHTYYLCDFRTLYGTIPETQFCRFLYNIRK